jgi:predicted DNA-binding transcriptional regulator AlpA
MPKRNAEDKAPHGQAHLEAKRQGTPLPEVAEELGTSTATCYRYLNTVTLTFPHPSSGRAILV